MDLMRTLYVKGDRFARGQTMAEYALILAAVAMVAYVGFTRMGTSITGMLGGLDSSL